MQPIQKKLMNIQNYLVYSADLTPDDSGYYYVVVNHRPFSEGIPICQDWYTQGEDQEDAVDMAKDLIVPLAESFIGNFLLYYTLCDKIRDHLLKRF